MRESANTIVEIRRARNFAVFFGILRRSAERARELSVSPSYPSRHISLFLPRCNPLSSPSLLSQRKSQKRLFRSRRRSRRRSLSLGAQWDKDAPFVSTTTYRWLAPAEKDEFFFCSRRETQHSFHGSSQPSVKNCTLKIRSLRSRSSPFFSFCQFHPVSPSPRVTRACPSLRSPSLATLYSSACDFRSHGNSRINRPWRNYRRRISGNFKPAFPVRTSGIARWLKTVPIVVFLMRDSMDLQSNGREGVKGKVSRYDTRLVTFGTILGNQTACNRVSGCGCWLLHHVASRAPNSRSALMHMIEYAN